MKYKIFLSLGIIIALLVFTVFSLIYLNTMMSDFLTKIDECNKNIGTDNEKAAEIFKEFSDEYENKKLIISFYMHDERLDSINMLVNKLNNLFDEGDEIMLISEIEELKAEIEKIYLENEVSFENIF